MPENSEKQPATLPHRLQKEIEGLKRKLLALSAVVEEVVIQAVKSLEERNASLAQKVIDRDPEIDDLEVELEEDCLKLLALYQPVAIDLRFIVAAFKINNDLERIGDMAVNIAERSIFLSGEEKVDIPTDFSKMTGTTLGMLKKSLDAFVEMDSGLAHKVIDLDDEVDDLHSDMYRKVADGIRRHPDQIERLISLLTVSRYLERIADHATNIAEDVIYLVDGTIVRHQK